MTELGPLQRKETYRDKVTLYYPPSKKKVLKEVKAMLKRENSSLSKFLVAKVEEYYRLHEPGNPQQLLPVILKIGKAFVAGGPRCQVKDCYRRIEKYLLWKKSKRNRERVGMCSLHSAQYLREFPLSYELLMHPIKKARVGENSDELP